MSRHDTPSTPAAPSLLEHQPPRGPSTRRAGRPGHTGRRTGIAAPAWLCGSACFSIRRPSAATRPPTSHSGGAGDGSRFGSFASSVVGRLSRRISSRGSQTRIRQGSFAPPELPGFPATTTPSDSRPHPSPVIHSRRRSPRLLVGGRDRKVGSPRFLDGSLDARRPQSPRRARPRHVLVSWWPVSGFTRSGRLATLGQGFTRPNRVHAFALRLTSSRPQASTARLPATPLVGFMANEQFP